MTKKRNSKLCDLEDSCKLIGHGKTAKYVRIMSLQISAKSLHIGQEQIPYPLSYRLVRVGILWPKQGDQFVSGLLVQCCFGLPKINREKAQAPVKWKERGGIVFYGLKMGRDGFHVSPGSGSCEGIWYPPCSNISQGAFDQGKESIERDIYGQSCCFIELKGRMY
jgi:hypothetical protein